MTTVIILNQINDNHPSHSKIYKDTITAAIHHSRFSENLVEEGLHVISHEPTLALNIVVDLQYLLLVVTYGSGQFERTQESRCLLEVATHLIYFVR